MENDALTRRPLATREKKWAKSFASIIARTGLRPNHISCLSVVMSASSCACLVLAGRTSHSSAVIMLFISSGIFIQLRLLCNLIDGMVAIEYGKKTKTGEIFNDLPDRISDVLIIAGAGYALHEISWGPLLGWLAASLALLTAYIRILGASLGLKQSFMGPMAKQHRMATLTFTFLACAALVTSNLADKVLIAGLLIVAAGSAFTCIRRLSRIVTGLEGGA